MQDLEGMTTTELKSLIILLREEQTQLKFRCEMLDHSHTQAIALANSYIKEFEDRGLMRIPKIK
jgi:hypothetical protein